MLCRQLFAGSKCVHRPSGRAGPIHLAKALCVTSSPDRPHAQPSKVELSLQVAERQLGHGQDYLLGTELTLADFYLLPSTLSFSLTEEGRAIYPKYPAFSRWRGRMEALPSVRKLRAVLPPRTPIEHAREWALSQTEVLMGWLLNERL